MTGNLSEEEERFGRELAGDEETWNKMDKGYNAEWRKVFRAIQSLGDE